MDNVKSPSMAVLLASGLAAGIFAYMVSRRSHKEETLPMSREAIVARARDMGTRGNRARRQGLRVRASHAGDEAHPARGPEGLRGLCRELLPASREGHQVDVGRCAPFLD